MSQYVFVNIWLLAFSILHAASIPVPEEGSANTNNFLQLIKNDPNDPGCKDCPEDVVYVDYVDYADFMKNHQLPVDGKLKDGVEPYADESYVYGDYEYFIEYLDDNTDAEKDANDKPKIVRYFEAVDLASSANDTNPQKFDNNLPTNLRESVLPEFASPDKNIEKTNASNVDSNSEVSGKQTNSEDVEMNSKDKRIKRSLNFQDYSDTPSNEQNGEKIEFIEILDTPIDFTNPNKAQNTDVSNEQEFIGTFDRNGNLEIFPNSKDLNLKLVRDSEESNNVGKVKNIENQNYLTYPDYVEYPDYLTGPLSGDPDDNEDVESARNGPYPVTSNNEDGIQDNTVLYQELDNSPEKQRKWLILEPEYDDSAEFNAKAETSDCDVNSRQNDVEYQGSDGALRNIENVYDYKDSGEYADYEDRDDVNPKDLEEIFIISSAPGEQLGDSNETPEFPIFLEDLGKFASWRTAKNGENKAGSRINSKFLGSPQKLKTPPIQRTPPKLSVPEKFEDYDDYGDYGDYGDYEEPKKPATKKSKGVGVLKNPKNLENFPSSKAPKQINKPVKISSSVRKPNIPDNKEAVQPDNSDIKLSSIPSNSQSFTPNVNANNMEIINSELSNKEPQSQGATVQSENKEELKTFDHKVQIFIESPASPIQDNLPGKSDDFLKAPTSASPEPLEIPHSSEKPVFSTNPAIVEVISVVGGQGRPGHKNRPIKSQHRNPPKRINQHGRKRGGVNRSGRNRLNRRNGIIQHNSGKHHQNHPRNLHHRKLNIPRN